MSGVSPKEVEKHLKGVQFPATKADLVKKAKMEGANKNIIDMLQNMPGQTFNGPVDVAKAIGAEDRTSTQRP